MSFWQSVRFFQFMESFQSRFYKWFFSSKVSLSVWLWRGDWVTAVRDIISNLRDVRHDWPEEVLEEGSRGPRTEEGLAGSLHHVAGAGSLHSNLRSLREVLVDPGIINICNIIGWRKQIVVWFRWLDLWNMLRPTRLLIVKTMQPCTTLYDDKQQTVTWEITELSIRFRNKHITNVFRKE